MLPLYLVPTVKDKPTDKIRQHERDRLETGVVARFEIQNLIVRNAI